MEEKKVVLQNSPLGMPSEQNILNFLSKTIFRMCILYYFVSTEYSIIIYKTLLANVFPKRKKISKFHGYELGT